MLSLILSAIGLGIMLSLVFIGPVFFLIIETSFSRGPRHALIFDLGVITADSTCIVAAFYGSDDLVSLIDQHPGFYRITAFLIFIYAMYMIMSRTKRNFSDGDKLISHNYLRTFINGYLFNILNIGVVLFWIVTVISVRSNYPSTEHFFIYVSLVILTYLSIDFFKIMLAKQFHDRLSDKVVNRIRKFVGGILILFSIFIFLQSFKKFNQFDKRLEESGYDKTNKTIHKKPQLKIDLNGFSTSKS